MPGDSFAVCRSGATLARQEHHTTHLPSIARMSIAADAIRNLITPLLTGWRVQLGRWIDGAPTDRFASDSAVGVAVVFQ